MEVVWRPWVSCEGGRGLHGGGVEAMGELLRWSWTTW